MGMQACGYPWTRESNRGASLHFSQHWLSRMGDILNNVSLSRCIARVSKTGDGSFCGKYQITTSVRQLSFYS